MLMRAAGGREGLAGFAAGFNVLRETCARFWDELYPPIDDEASDPSEQMMVRVAALGELVSNQGLLRDLQAMPILEARGIGAFSLREINLARGKVTAVPGESVPESGLIDAGLAQDRNLSDTLAHIDSAKGELDQLISDLGERLGADRPDLSPLKRVLVDMADALGGSRAGADKTEKASSSQLPSPSDSGGSALGGNGVGVGELRTREQVMAALDNILDYYDRHEPASPIPLLIKRAKRLVPLDFLALMEDLAPASVKQLKELGGVVKGGASAKEKNANGE